MSNSDQDQTREQKIEEMNSMCTMIKGKRTYNGLPKELEEGDFHLVELAEACECQENDAELESIDSEDEETMHEYNGKQYTGKQLLDLWESEADQAKQNFKEYEKANKPPPGKKQKTGKADKADKADGAGAKGAKAKTGTAWSRFLVGNRTVMGPSIYKKYCDSVGIDWEIPVKFTGPDGQPIFKVLDVGKYDEKIRWAKNPEQNLAEEGVDYY